MDHQRHHSFTSRHAGFVPIDGRSGSPSGNDMEQSIPLANVRSNASTVGARKPLHAQSTSYESSQTATADKKGDELRSRHAGRRRKHADGLDRRGTGDSNEVKLNAMGRLYETIVGFSTVTRYMVYVVPIGLLLAVPLVVLSLTGHQDDIPVGTTVDDNKVERQGPPLFKLFFWIQITWLTLWAAKIAAWLLPKIFIFFCGIVSMGVRKYATILKNLKIALSLFFWALASWLTFKSLFQDAYNVAIPWVVAVEAILGALFVSSAVLLCEKAFVQLISVSYHQRSFANRIKASKREIHLLSLLYDSSRTLFPMYCREFTDEDYVINDSIETMLRQKAGRRKLGAATPMKIIGDVGRFGDKVTSAVGKIAHEITGKQVFNPNSAHSIVLEALEKRPSSEALARRIWMSFVLEGKDALYLDDFEEVLGPAYKQEAEEAFNAVDSDVNGDISLDEMLRKVVEIGQERKAITEGMKDIGQALRVFDKVLLFVVLLLVVFIFLIFFRSSFVAVVTSAGTTFLSLSFVFAVTAQEFLGSCIFLFVKHPYDVGDRVTISKVNMIVDRISLLYTVFTRIDMMQVVQVPNIQLNSLWIDNVSRSKAMKETFELNVSFDTSFEDVELLRAEMENFVRAPENSRDFQPDFSISIGGVGDLDQMVLLVSIKHKSNWHNETVRAKRRSKFMCALALALKKIPIYGPGGGTEVLGGPTNPTYSVAVTDQFASSARDEAARKKDADRLVPATDAHQSKEAANEAERHAVTELNNQSAAAETEGLWEYREKMDANSRGDRPHHHSSQRARDIETVRSGLLKRESTRGRRKAGDGLHQLAPTLSAQSNQSATAAAATSASASELHHPHPPGRLSPFDEEASTGLVYPDRPAQPPSASQRFRTMRASQRDVQQASGHPLTPEQLNRLDVSQAPDHRAPSGHPAPPGHPSRGTESGRRPTIEERELPRLYPSPSTGGAPRAPSSGHGGFPGPAPGHR